MGLATSKYFIITPNDLVDGTGTSNPSLGSPQEYIAGVPEPDTLHFWAPVFLRSFVCAIASCARPVFNPALKRVGGYELSAFFTLFRADCLVRNYKLLKVPAQYGDGGSFFS